MDSSVTTTLLLEFEVAFPNEKKQTLSQYLSGWDRELALKSAAFFLSFNDADSQYSNNWEFLKMFFKQENRGFALELHRKILQYEAKGIRVRIVNAYSSLKLFEYFFTELKGAEPKIGAQLEINLFKAYLALNSELTTKQRRAFPTSQRSDKRLKIPMMHFCAHYPLSDKMNYDIREVWICQIVKAIHLFEFLESHPLAVQLLEAFLLRFKCSTWKEYLLRILPLTKSSVTRDKETYTNIVVQAGNSFARDCQFIESLIVEENDDFERADFLTLRGKPFYKIEDGVYRVIYDLFVVEKIFKGVYFLLRDVNQALPESQQIKNIRSFYTHKFSEQVLCYKLMEEIYQEGCIRFSGETLENMGIVGEPDYYLRSANNILLIESKDFLIHVDKKMSFDFDTYNREFAKILDCEKKPNGKTKNRAVVQLAKNIRKLLESDFSADSDYNYRNITIYPILLIHDHQYDALGFNELVDFWFQRELRKLRDDGLFIHKVLPLSVVNVDSLIYHQEGLAAHTPLHVLLKKYHDSKKAHNRSQIRRLNKQMSKYKSQEEIDGHNDKLKQFERSRLIPFSFFIKDYFQRNGGNKLPESVFKVAPTLFDENG